MLSAAWAVNIDQHALHRQAAFGEQKHVYKEEGAGIDIPGLDIGRSALFTLDMLGDRLVIRGLANEHIRLN